MKLEYIQESKESLIRLYGFTTKELSLLSKAFRGLTVRDQTIQLEEMPFVEPMGGCKLTLKCGERDKGITPMDRDNSFECELTAKSWEHAADLADGLAGSVAGSFQWLYEVATPIQFLLSQSGAW